MPKPSIYFVIVFFVLLYYLIKEGYWRGLVKGLIIEIKNNYFPGIVVLIMAVFSVLFIDLPLSNYFSRPNSLSFLQPLISKINGLGDGNILFSLLVFLTIISYFLKKERYLRIFSIALSSSVFAGLINLFIKMLVTRERPYMSLSPYKFLAYADALKKHNLFQVEYLSMPSGHTIIIFAAMIPLVLYYKNRVLKFIFAMLPILVGFARIYLFKHWLSDVIIAAFLGTMIGIVTYRVNINRLKMTSQN